MKTRFSSLVVFILIIVLLVGCSTSAQQLTATSVTSPIVTPRPTNIPLPTTTQIPGFEGWSVINPQYVDIATENNTLILKLKRHALWFMNQRGVLIYKLVEGNFKITADIYTSKTSNLSEPPGGDGTVQLSGLMARNGSSAQENYVFIVAGDDGDGLSIETKNTTDNLSKYNGPSWDSANAELRICRVNSTFNLYKRHIGTNEAWILATTFDRPDLPSSLQVGVNIYTDNTPDLQARIENLKIEKTSDEADCIGL